jgi:hypothetical protein
MEFKINYGPWETVFSGKLFKHEVEVVMNPEKYFLTIIYDIKEGKKIGALVDGHKALVAKGHMSSFIESMPKKTIGIIKSNGQKTLKMLFVSFDPIYINFKQEDFERKIDNAIKKSFNNVETIIELGKTSSLILKETSMSPENDYAPIIGDPFMARSLLSGLKKTAMDLIDFTKINNDNNEKEVNIQLGLNKNRQIIKDELKNFLRTIIHGQKQSEINYCSYILAENFLLENNNVIIFDTNNYFNGLGESSKNENELKENLVDFSPSGFPIKKFKAKENLKTSFDKISFSILFKIMKIKDYELKEFLTKLDKKYSTPEELLTIIKNEEFNEFKKLKLERIIKIIENNFEGLFEKNDSIEEITKKWSGNRGRATIININNLKKEEQTIFVNAILKEILNNDDNKNIIIFLPEINNFVEYGKEQLVNVVLALENLGVGFVFGMTKEYHELKQNIITKINIVNGKDVAISTKNNKNYRVILRPSLSGAPKT